MKTRTVKWQVIALTIALLCLPLLALAQTGIDIKIVQESADKATVEATGSLIRYLTREELQDDPEPYLLDEDKDGLDVTGLFEAYYQASGKNPLLLKRELGDPKVMNAFFIQEEAAKTFDKWEATPLCLIIRPVKAEVLSVESNPTILKTQTFENDSETKTADYKVSITETVTNTAEESWSETNTVTVGQSVTYEVSVGGDIWGASATVGGETRFDYSHEWGKGGSESEEIELGSEAGLTVTLDPGEKAYVNLTATQGTMKARIVYEVAIGGSVIFADPVNWKKKAVVAEMTDLLKAAGKAKEGTWTVEETIEIGHFSGGNVTMSDDKDTPASKATSLGAATVKKQKK